VEKRWLFASADAETVRMLSERLRISQVLANILVNRQVTSVEEADLFLSPELTDLHDLFLLPDIQKATERIREAALTNEKVMIYGDYDVDGITATALMVHFLRLLDMRVDYYIPHRIREGYGLNAASIRRFIDEDVKLIITVDCGTNAVDEIALATEHGIDVVITDHHEPGNVLPRAAAQINPKLTGSLYPFRDLSGVGVAFKLACAIVQSLSRGRQTSNELRGFLLDAVGLVALGTVADVVPLLGENRILARYGLKALQTSQQAGVDALIESVDLRGVDISSADISFRIAPRLNAAGRMAEAALCVELFITNSTSEARIIAEKLGEINRERQRTQEEIFRSVRSKLEETHDGLDDIHAIVMADEGWHAGVLGIVASKMVEEYWRPTVLIDLAGDEGKGSGRSVQSFNLFEALQQCDEHLIAYGGHAQAAGVRIRSDKIDGFRDALNQIASRCILQENIAPSVTIDMELMLSDVNTYLIREISRMAPHGEGNRPPIFASSGLEIAGQPRLLGPTGKHISFYVRQGSTSLRAIGFGMGDLYEKITAGSRRCSLAYQPKINEWKGSRSVELEIKDIRFTD